MPRNIIEVIDKIIPELPSVHSYTISQLQYLKQTASYAPPEAMPEKWYRLSNLMQSIIGNPATEIVPDWATKITKILRGEL
jgi:hypothetical protein